MAALGVSAACSRRHVVTNGSQCDSAPVSRMLNRMLTVRKWLSTPSTRCAAQSLTACRDCTGSTLTSCHHQPWPSCMASSPTPSCWPSWAPSTPSCGRSTGLVRACVLHACMVACVCAGRLPPCSWPMRSRYDQHARIFPRPQPASTGTRGSSAGCSRRPCCHPLGIQRASSISSRRCSSSSRRSWRALSQRPPRPHGAQPRPQPRCG